MNEIQVFKFESAEVRTVSKCGEPWFVASDVCGVLDIQNIRQNVAKLDDDEKGVCSIDTLGGPQQMNIINESGLYSLILTSRKPEAKRFKKWVTSEVLPAIRKTGKYESTPNHLIPQTLPEALRLAADLAEQNATLAPKAAIADRIAVADGCLSIREAAKALKVPEKKLVHWLLINGWMYRDQKGRLRGYAGKTPRYLNHKITPIPIDEDLERVAVQVLITAEGLVRLAEIFNGGDSLPQVETIAHQSATIFTA